MIDAVVSSVDVQQAPYPVKCETDNVQLDIDSPDGASHHHHQHEHPAGLNQQPAVSVASTVPDVPSTIAVVTSQSLILQDPSIFSQRCDAVAAAAAAAAGRNITPVKCTSSDDFSRILFILNYTILV